MNVARFETIKWNELKTIRNRLLKETDWTQIPDASILESKKLAFTQYRQELRDIPQNFQNADDVVWPQKPAIS